MISVAIEWIVELKGWKRRELKQKTRNVIYQTKEGNEKTDKVK